MSRSVIALLAVLLVVVTVSVTAAQSSAGRSYWAPVSEYPSIESIGTAPNGMPPIVGPSDGTPMGNGAGLMFPNNTSLDAYGWQVDKDNEKSKKQDKAKKEKQDKLEKAATGAYKTLFYDNDFGYLTDPAYSGHNLGDSLKQISASRCAEFGGGALGGHGPVLDLGGQYRYRFHSERNHRGLGLTGIDDEFLLQRTRLFANLRLGDHLRFYGEYIDAVSTYEDFAARPIEENRSDLLNLFVDGTMIDTGNGKLLGRVGRQELLYGAQRAVSPLDWANTRRTFDGGKLMWQGKHLNVDGFWARPVPPNVRHFDNPNLDRQFYGVYSTYKNVEDAKLEGYWLAFDNDATGFRVDSIGGRYYGESDNFLMEFWGNYQFGTNADNTSHSAGAWTLGLGRKSDRAWKPTCWVYYDWASGDDTLGTGNGYFQFFPLAHKYLGFMDLYGRRNIESPNVQFSLQPTKKLKLLAWYYYFFLQDRRDSPYSVVMTPFFPGVAPGSASLGHEIDLLASYEVSPRSGLLFGYSHFFAGAYYDTPGLPYSGDANFFYTQYQINF